jgi:Tfp pilus assembly protein PilO
MSEVTLKQWIEATWFKGAARLLMILGGVALGVCGPIFTLTVTDTKREITTVKERLVQQTGELAVAIEALKVQVQETDQQVDQMNRRVDGIVSDIGIVRGIVEEMQATQRRTAARPSWMSPADLSIELP